MTEILKNLGLSDERYEDFRGLVKRTFPDKRCEVSNTLLDAIVCALPPPARAALGVAEALVEMAPDALATASMVLGGKAGIAQKFVRPGECNYYLAHATHARTGAGAHKFTSKLPMVRVSLPQTVVTDFYTELGVVYAGDHKLHTVELFRAKYNEFLGFEVDKVILTTPTRYLGARFAAIATYEVFDVNGTRRAWVLEAGMATGEALVLYASPNGQPIDRKAWYAPTPFSDAENWYHGYATFNPRGPEGLSVEVSEAASKNTPHMTVTVNYFLLGDGEVKTVFPAELTAQAALRVAAIAVARGSRDPLFVLLAPFASTLDWEKAPQ